jgi:phosphoribosylanthranilate isomerase
MSVLVKVCGIRRGLDAREAVKAGADLLGFNFWKGSKRWCALEEAGAMVRDLPPHIVPVGVFVNPTRAEVLRAIEVAGVLAVQLHGDETEAFAKAMPLPVIRAVRVENARSLSGLSRRAGAAFLVDAPSAGYGGSGQRFDWRLARGASRVWPLLLAGGLTPDNVADAVRTVRPEGVDVASGVERAPGVKDAGKMARFIRRAKEA